MRSDIRRAFVGCFLIAAGAGLAACGDDEPHQRAAFMTFLQTRIVDKTGLHVPLPSDDEKKSFGPYLAQYDIILGFQSDMKTALAGVSSPKDLNFNHNINELIAHRADLLNVVTELSKSADAARKLLEETDAKRAALKQPDDLKAVYSAAYERDVTAPAQAVIKSVPSAVDSANAAVALANYIDAHRDRLRINGASVAPTDEKTSSDLKVLLNDVRQKEERADHDRKIYEPATRPGP
jgi:hypothetical protein